MQIHTMKSWTQTSSHLCPWIVSIFIAYDFYKAILKCLKITFRKPVALFVLRNETSSVYWMARELLNVVCRVFSFLVHSARTIATSMKHYWYKHQETDLTEALKFMFRAWVVSWGRCHGWNNWASLLNCTEVPIFAEPGTSLHSVACLWLQLPWVWC